MLLNGFTLLIACSAVTASACGAGPFGLQLLPHNRLSNVSSVKLAVTQMTIYATQRSVDLSKLSGYPLDWFPDNHWHPRLWDDRATDRELTPLIDWLKEQRDLWSWRHEHPGEVRRISEIIDDLSSWQLPGITHRSRICYLYSSTRKPGIAGFDSYDWLYFYYLNAEGTAITEITNAFR